MKEVFGLIHVLLEKDIRAKNAVSLLIAILSAFAFFLIASQKPWFRPVVNYGTVAVASFVLALAVAAFVSTSLVWSLLALIFTNVHKRIQADKDKELHFLHLRDTLDSLTQWQRMFLCRFVVEGRSQIKDFEVGQFRATWDSEMTVLIEKGVIKEYHRAGVYELLPAYREYLQQNLDLDTGRLS